MAESFLYRIICGFFLGLSILAPGFSGSIVMITMGIYEDIIHIFSNPFKDFKKNVMYMLPLAIGGFVSAILFVLLFKFLFDHYLKVTYFLFVGLIGGNLPVIVNVIKRHGFRRHYWIGVVGAFAAAFTMSVVSIGTDKTMGAEDMTVGLYMLAASGFMTGSVGFIPGMSVTTVLISLGVYGPLIHIAESLIGMDFAYIIHLAVFGGAAVIGLVITSNGIKALFEKFPGFANASVLGFLLGSLAGILLQAVAMPDVNFTWAAGVLTLLAGFVGSVLFIRSLGK